MKIEPCPVCGSEVVFHSAVEIAQCRNYKCLYEGPIHDEGAQKHNRFSRIVRAAEALVKARRTGTIIEITDAGYALMDAVEGGAE